ncbi:MAG: hypothetical protein AAF798_19410 [Bacteroidota bacterium]
MSTIEIRPRFRELYHLSPSETIQKIKKAIADEQNEIRGLIVDQHVLLFLPAEEQHYWSPQLSIDVEQHEEGALIRGLYGPRPSVWLLFVFLYSVIGAISLFVAITGFSQYSLGIPAPVLWVLPIAAILTLLLYLSAKAGERLSREQMYQLHYFLDDVLGERTLQSH